MKTFQKVKELGEDGACLLDHSPGYMGASSSVWCYLMRADERMGLWHQLGQLRKMGNGIGVTLSTVRVEHRRMGFFVRGCALYSQQDFSRYQKIIFYLFIKDRAVN